MDSFGNGRVFFCGDVFAHVFDGRFVRQCLCESEPILYGSRDDGGHALDRGGINALNVREEDEGRRGWFRGIGLILFFVLIRNQTGISEKEFLKSMISHHGSALLMCQNKGIRDPDIKKLCEEIISSQQEQIDWMKTKLPR